jgi:membrane protein
MSNRSGGILSVGIIVALWSASKGMNAIIKSLNRAYDVEESRSFFVVRGISIVLTIAMIFVILTALLLPVFGERIGMYIFSSLHLSDEFILIWSSIRFVLCPLILFFIFLILYYFSPSQKITCRTAVPGAAIAAIGWLLISLGFSFYVNHFSNYSATYGSLGGIIILMLWLYVSAFILMLGGEINALLHKKGKPCS